MNPTKETANRAANIMREWLAGVSLMDNGETNFERKIMGNFLMGKIQESNPISEDNLTAFTEALAEEIQSVNESGYSELSRLYIDYGIGGELADLADEHSIHHSHFPIKSSIYVGYDYITESKGYGSPTKYHYLLENGKWLITTLSGQDIEKVKDHVVNGTELVWEIQE